MTDGSTESSIAGLVD